MCVGTVVSRVWLKVSAKSLKCVNCNVMYVRMFQQEFCPMSVGGCNQKVWMRVTEAACGNDHGHNSLRSLQAS